MAKNKSLFSEDEYKALLGTLNQHQEVALKDNLATNENTSDLDYKDNFDQFTVKFDSTFNIGGEQDLYINQEANKEINKILEKDGAVAIQGINNETSTLIRKNTDDKNYQDYQKINNHVLKNLENNTNFMEYVPQVRREELSHYLTNKIYGFQKNIKDKLPVNVSPSALKEMSLVAQDYTDKYILPLGNHLANKQASDFQDSTPGDAFRKGLYEYFSNINKGVAGRVSQFEFTGGEDGRLAKFFQKGADKAQSWAEEMDPPTGIYTLSAQEIANTSKEELGNIDRSIITLSRAWGSSGQQALGVANTISMMTPARLGVRGALTGANIASNLFAESGAFEQGIKQEYDNLKIKALEQRDKLDYDEFKSLFSIDVDGKMKTIDEVDDKKLRELSRKVATNYAATSTALEGVSLFMDRKLGAPAKGILKSMQNNPALTSKLWFNRAGRLGKNMTAEGLTEALQEFASEHYKEMKLPQYEKDWDAILESGKIGALFGVVQFGGDKLLRSVTDQTFSYSENTRSKETQYAIDRLVQERQRRNLGDFSKPKHQIHNALVVGNDKDPLTFKKKIADHYKMDIEEVEAIHDEARSNDLDFSEKAVDKALKTNPEFNELFDIDESGNIEDNLNQDGEIDGFDVDQQFDGDIDQEAGFEEGNQNFIDDNIDEQIATNEGLDYQEGVDDQLASTMINDLKTKLEELEKTPTGTDLSVAQKKGRISAIKQKIAELGGDLKKPNQNKKKRQKGLVKKAKKVEEKKKPKGGFTVSEVKGKNRRLKKQAILESRTQYSREDILEMDDEKTNEVFHAISDKNASSRLKHIKNAIKTAEKKKKQKKPKVSKNLKNLSKLKNSSEEVQIKEQQNKSESAKTKDVDQQSFEKELSRRLNKEGEGLSLDDRMDLEDSIRKELEEKLSKPKQSNVDAMLEGDTLVEKKKKPTKKRVQEKKEAVLEGADEDFDIDSLLSGDKESENTVVAKSSVDQSILDQIKKDREEGSVNQDNPNQDVEEAEQKLNEAREILGAGGKVLRDNPKDIKASTDENGRLKQTVYGKIEAEMHAKFEKKWAMLKKRGDYTESQFSEFVEKHDADMRANALFALNWISWVKRRRPLSKTQEKIESAKMLAQSLGARFTLNKTKGAVEDLDIFEETSEVYREGIGEEETAGVSEPKLSVNDFSKIAKSFFVENNFKVNTIDMNKLIEKARSLVFTDEPVSFQEFIDEIGSTEGLVDQNNKTFIQLMQSPQIRQSFKRYYLSMHIDNVGSVNNGINKGNPNSEIIQLEAKINENHAFDEESDKTPYQQVRITPEIGLNNRVRPSQAVKMLYTRYIKDVEGGPVVRLATLSKRDLHSVKWTAQGINPNTGLLYHTPIKTMYKFLNTTAMIKLWKTIHQSHKNNKNSIMDMIPISTRGENTKILFAGITKQIRNTDKKQYFLNEVEHYKEIYTDKSEEDVLKLVADVIGGIYSTKRLPQSEQIILEEVYNGDTAEFKNGLMAKHQALTALFGREYISLPIPKLMQRIKIPTTPVYTSPTLPPRKIMFFDPEGTSLEIIDSRTGLQLHSSKQKTLIDNTMQYIRDGKLITSEHVFKTQYPEHFGNPASAMRLKTVHASNDQQGNVYMSKHDEKTLALRNVNYEANLLDKDGNVIALFRRRGDGNFLNIYEPSDIAFENPIDYIGTDDEAKIRFGNLKENNVVHTVPGSSVGIIKYTSKKIKNYSMISTQLAQYQTDPEFQSFLMRQFNNDKSSYLSPKKLATKLLNMADNPKKINDFIKELARHYPDVVTSNVEGLGQLGVGNHPTSIAFLKNIIKNKILRPINKFHVQGTYLDFNSDDIGDVKRDEIIMPNEKNLMFKILNLIGTDAPSNLDEKINFINNWLKDNKVHVMVTRSPITNKDGWGLYKIKEISNQIGDSFIINNNETKERFEGDNDQDNGHIIYLDEDQYKFLKRFYNPKIQGLNLAQYKTSADERNTGSMYDTLKGAEDMTYGSTAIGEVVSIARYAGLLNSFGKNNSTITLRVSDGDPNDIGSGTNIRVAFRGLDEIIEDPKMVKKDGTYFKGTLGDYLRTYLQAAVDHPKVLLLNEWEYDRDTLIRKLFYFPDPSQDEMVKEMALTGMTRGFIKKVLNLTSNISNMRTDSQDQASFENIFEYSRTYHDFIKDRKAWLTDALNWGVNDEPAPMYSNEFGEVEVVDANFFQNKGSSNLIERTSVIYDQIKNRVRMDPDSPVSQFFNVDPELNKLTHIKALNELRPYFEETMQGFTGQINEKQIQEARTYASQLQTELYNSVNKVERVKEGEYADKINANSFDHSDVFMKLNEKYVEKYSQLTDGQKHIATFAFLRGLAIESSNTGKLNIRKSMNVLPPVTNDENNTTLKPEVVKEYFKQWNKVFQSFKANHKATMKKNRLKAPDYLKQSREILNCG